MLDDEPWSEEEHACFVQVLKEQSGSINWHVTAHRIGTKSAQQVGNFLAVSACCPTSATPSLTRPPQSPSPFLVGGAHRGSVPPVEADTWSLAPPS